MANRPRSIDGPPGRPDGDRPRGPLFLRRLDTDRNGRISKAEMDKARELFAELDSNDDGLDAFGSADAKHMRAARAEMER